MGRVVDGWSASVESDRLFINRPENFFLSS